MSEKVKVSREVANFIESCSLNGVVYWEDQLLHEHVLAINNDFKNTKEEAKCLDKYSPIELAKILINGYEIEETPEEKILARWTNVENILPERRFYYREGILDTLRLLGVKIKGINK